MPITFGQLNAGEWPATAPNRAVFKGVLGFLPNKIHPEIQRELREVLATEGDEWLPLNGLRVISDGGELPGSKEAISPAPFPCRT